MITMRPIVMLLFDGKTTKWKSHRGWYESMIVFMWSALNFALYLLTGSRSRSFNHRNYV